MIAAYSLFCLLIDIALLGVLPSLSVVLRKIIIFLIVCSGLLISIDQLFFENPVLIHPKFWSVLWTFIGLFAIRIALSTLNLVLSKWMLKNGFSNKFREVFSTFLGTVFLYVFAIIMFGFQLFVILE